MGRLRMLGRPLGLAIAAIRVVLGVVAYATPDRVARPWVGAASEPHQVAVLGRALGGRDVALGLGALGARQDPAALSRWVRLGVLSDAGDTLATLISFRRLPAKGRWLVLASSAGAALAGAAALAARAGGPAGDATEH